MILDVLTGFLTDSPVTPASASSTPTTPVDDFFSMLIDFAEYIHHAPAPALSGFYILTLIIRVAFQLRIAFTWLRAAHDTKRLYKRVSRFWLLWIIIEVPCKLSGFDRHMSEIVINFDPQTATVPVAENYSDLLAFALAFLNHLILGQFPFVNSYIRATIGLSILIGLGIVFLLASGFLYNFLKAARNDWDDNMLMDSYCDLIFFSIALAVFFGGGVFNLLVPDFSNAPMMFRYVLNM